MGYFDDWRAGITGMLSFLGLYAQACNQKQTETLRKTQHLSLLVLWHIMISGVRFWLRLCVLCREQAIKSIYIEIERDFNLVEFEV